MVRTIPAATLLVESESNLVAARSACRTVREFLNESGVTTEEQDALELALAGAVNNAVKYAPPEASHLPIRIEAWIEPGQTELRITDHTGGFDFPETAELPPDDSEFGRGLFLIQALTDEARYLRGRGEGCLVLRKRRQVTVPPVKTRTVAEIAGDLAESQQTLDLMTEELSSAYESLSAIFRFSAELPSGGGAADFIARWLGQLATIVEADWYLLRLFRPATGELEVAATSASAHLLKPIRLADPAATGTWIERTAAVQRCDIWFEPGQSLAADDPLGELGPVNCGFAHPILVNDALVGVLTLGRSRKSQTFQAGQVNVIQTFADFLGIQFRNAQYQEEQVRTRLDARDLEIAARIQHSLLPVSLPELAGIRLVSHFRSARQVGGDYYEALIRTDGSLLLVVADVMGKGLPAAMFAAIFRSLVGSRRDSQLPPGEFLEWLNRNLADELGRVDMFITAQIAVLDPVRRHLTVASAGHPAVLLVDGAGKEFTVENHGLPLGVCAGERYDTVGVPLPLNFRLLLYTDGLTEARNREGAFFGLEPLRRWLVESACRREAIGAARDRLVGLVDHFGDGAVPADDQAFVLVAENADNES